MNSIQSAIHAIASFLSGGLNLIFSSDNILFILPASGCIIITVWEIIASFLDSKDD